MNVVIKSHFDLLKPSDGQNDFKQQDGRRPTPEHVRGRYTQSYSAEDRTGTVRMPMGCILAQSSEYD